MLGKIAKCLERWKNTGKGRPMMGRMWHPEKGCMEMWDAGKVKDAGEG